MFKKYYQDANNDIKADEAFINSVIENAQKKRVPSQKSYYKYALTAAAAVVVLSATAITMPLLTDNHNDGVISVVTQTAQPSPPSPVNTAVPNPSESVKKDITKPQTAEKETKTDNQNTEITEKKEEKKNETVSFKVIQETDETETADAVPETGIETDGVTMFSAVLSGGMSDTAEDMAADSGTFKAETTDGLSRKEAAASTAESSSKYTSGGGGGGSSMNFNGVIAAPSMQSAVLPPSGYYVSEAGNGRYVFTNDGGATITVITENTNSADTEPVYDGLNVSFISNGISFSIYSDGAEKSVIDELVNSLR